LIFVDGKSTGLQTPSQLKGWEFAADHTVSLELKGYYAERRKVAAGLHPPDLNVILPRVAHLSASTTPVPASVLVDGEAVGTTPAEVDLPADRDIKLALHAPGFVTVTRDLRLKPDESTSLVAALDPLAMVAIKSTPPGARVSVDGAVAVTAPADLELTAGAVHRIQASVPGLPPVIRSIKVPPGKTEHLNLTFEDPRDRRARAELSRLRSREAVARRKLSRTEARPGDEYMANARKLNEENSLSDELERIEAREQELEDEIANHDQELEDRIKAAALEASAPRPPGSPGDARPETQAEKP